MGAACGASPCQLCVGYAMSHHLPSFVINRPLIDLWTLRVAALISKRANLLPSTEGFRKWHESVNCDSHKSSSLTGASKCTGNPNHEGQDRRSFFRPPRQHRNCNRSRCRAPLHTTNRRPPQCDSAKDDMTTGCSSPM